MFAGKFEENLLPAIGVMAIICARCQGTEQRREVDGEHDNGGRRDEIKQGPS